MSADSLIEGWRIQGPPDGFGLVRPALEACRAIGKSARWRQEFGALSAFVKASSLRLRPALRHALRGAVGLEIPRLQEFRNLAWLRSHDFLAARPLLAGVWVRHGLPRFQFLCTEFVPARAALDEALPGLATDERRILLAHLARDLARLHALGFVHRDLYPRNLLVGTPQDPRCTFLDAWRGGPGPGLRGPNHDLACFFLDGATLLVREEQIALLATYRSESRRLGRNLHRSWPSSIEKARARLHRRESRRRPGLQADWSCPPLPPSSLPPSPSNESELVANNGP